MSEAMLVKMLKARWAPPEWATFSNVEMPGGRYADAIAVNLWRSRGYEVIGFEVKTARSDFLREIKSPEKGDATGKFCHKFYIVALPGVVRDHSELPLGWGLIEPRGESLVIKREGQREKLDTHPMSVALMCAILRRASAQSASEIELEAARMQGRDAGIAETEARHTATPAKRLQETIDRYEKRDREFFEKTGLRLDQFTDARHLSQVQALHQRLSRARIETWPISELEDAVKRAREAQKQINATIELFTEFVPLGAT